MVEFNCKKCGAAIKIYGDEKAMECEYCGSIQTLPKAKDEVYVNLFNRANNLRRKAEFDKAAQVYENIIEKDDSDPEAYWGLVLCKYGIEYVEDVKTSKRIPTCHRTSHEAIMSDVDYISAIENSDEEQKKIYESEACAIDKIQRDIISIVNNEKPYDIFICYKETDENGKRTKDSVIANEIYHNLTDEGFKVFYAAITLEDKLGTEYEPYIFAALNTAKVMLVIGTKPEYFNAVWVKNEWFRFLKLMKDNKKKLLIPCYRDMDAYDLPEEFSHLQAQDMGKIGFINDIVRGIKKVIVKEEPKQPVKETVVVKTVETASTAGTTQLIKRGNLALEDENFDDAIDFFERALDTNAECAEAYLGKLMADLKVKNMDALKDCLYPFDFDLNYEKILRFGDEKLRSTIEKYNEEIHRRNERMRLVGEYNSAVKAMSTASNAEQYAEAAAKFQNLGDYKDSKILWKECLEEARKCLEKKEKEARENIYSRALILMDSNKESDLKQAISMFESISGKTQVDDKIKACEARIETLYHESVLKLVESVYYKDWNQAIFMLENSDSRWKSEWESPNDLIKKCRSKIEKYDKANKRSRNRARFRRNLRSAFAVTGKIMLMLLFTAAVMALNVLFSYLSTVIPTWRMVILWAILAINVVILNIKLGDGMFISLGGFIVCFVFRLIFVSKNVFDIWYFIFLLLCQVQFIFTLQATIRDVTLEDFKAKHLLFYVPSVIACVVPFVVLLITKETNFMDIVMKMFGS